MRTWELNVKISVADSWVADGFNLKERMDEVEEALTRMLPFAYGHELEIKLKILSAPTPQVIAALQDGTLKIGD